MRRLGKAAYQTACLLHRGPSAGAGACHRQQPVHCFTRHVAAAAAFGSYATARIGDHISEIETPSLIVDLDTFESNCRRLEKSMQRYPNVKIRPHAKAHKCAQIAQLQLALLGQSAVGVCCQKVSEAEAMAAGGITDIFVSNEVVDSQKLKRLAALAAQGVEVSIVVDALEPLESLAKAAAEHVEDEPRAMIGVLVDVNVGQDRCGVDTPDQAAALAEQILEYQAETNRSVYFAGIQAYHGGLQHVRDPKDRASAVQKVVDRAAAAVDAIMRKVDLECETVTGGGSGTYSLEAASGVFTEVQPGSFIFGDADYARVLPPSATRGEWDQSLWVLTQVMSVSEARKCAVVDAGLKAVSLDSGPPVLLEQPNVRAGLVEPAGTQRRRHDSRMLSFEGVEYQNGGDEHGKLLWPQAIHQLPPAQLPPIGTKLLLQPGHCDPTVNMYDHIIAVRNNKVVGIWPITARGPGL